MRVSWSRQSWLIWRPRLGRAGGGVVPILTAEQIKAAIEAAPDHVHDPDSPYDPNDPKAVSEYFKDAVITRGGGYQVVRAALAAKMEAWSKRPRQETAKGGDKYSFVA